MPHTYVCMCTDTFVFRLFIHTDVNILIYKANKTQHNGHYISILYKYFLSSACITASIYAVLDTNTPLHRYYHHKYIYVFICTLFFHSEVFSFLPWTCLSYVYIRGHAQSVGWSVTPTKQTSVSWVAPSIIAKIGLIVKIRDLPWSARDFTIVPSAGSQDSNQECV